MDTSGTLRRAGQVFTAVLAIGMSSKAAEACPIGIQATTCPNAVVCARSTTTLKTWCTKADPTGHFNLIGAGVPPSTGQGCIPTRGVVYVYSTLSPGCGTFVDRDKGPGQGFGSLNWLSLPCNCVKICHSDLAAALLRVSHALSQGSIAMAGRAESPDTRTSVGDTHELLLGYIHQATLYTGCGQSAASSVEAAHALKALIGRIELLGDAPAYFEAKVEARALADRLLTESVATPTCERGIREE